MTSDHRELFRGAILRVLEANNTRFGLTPMAIAIMCGPFGFPLVSKMNVAGEIGYLSDKGYVAMIEKRISPENAAWRITAEGRDWLAQQTNEL